LPSNQASGLPLHPGLWSPRAPASKPELPPAHRGPPLHRARAPYPACDSFDAALITPR
jgi:hypothetical protein